MKAEIIHKEGKILGAKAFAFFCGILLYFPTMEIAQETLGGTAAQVFPIS
jgi:hypothetical protein